MCVLACAGARAHVYVCWHDLEPAYHKDYQTPHINCHSVVTQLHRIDTMTKPLIAEDSYDKNCTTIATHNSILN